MWPLDDRSPDPWVEATSEPEDPEREAPVGWLNKIVEGAPYCEVCGEQYLEVRGIRGCPWCAK